jgi:hypothetical protein
VTVGGDKNITRGRIYQDVYEKRVDSSEVLDVVALELAWIDGAELRFRSDEHKMRGLTDGIFLLKVPDAIDLAAGDAFAANFYRGSTAVSPYGRFRDITHQTFGDPLLGFHQRINQIEQFLLERRFWSEYYPPEITRLGETITQLSRIIVRSVLASVDIPAELWAQATGGCTDTAGSYHLTFNHYRPDFEGCGLSSHKDDGFVTILRTTSSGLEVNRRTKWERVEPLADHFVINFGLSMELLTSRSATPVSAIMHRVAHQVHDRSSFGHFTSSNCQHGEDMGIYRYAPGAGLERICSSRELIDNNDYEIYTGTDAPTRGQT